MSCLTKGGGLRPIAVGEVLTSKCAARAVLPDTLQILSPLQVGVGLLAGCEAILHSVTNVHESPSIPADHRFTLLVDFSNAFNSVDRAAMFPTAKRAADSGTHSKFNGLKLPEVRSRIPTIASWMECSYGSQPNLLLDDQTIPSCCGVQQGDPLGPLGFALVLHTIIENIRESACRHLPPLLEKGPPGSHCHLRIVAVNCSGCRRKSGPRPVGCRGEKVCFPRRYLPGCWHHFHPPRHRVPRWRE